MKCFLFALAFFGVTSGAVAAMPILPVPAIPDAQNDLVVEVATSSYKRAAYRSCKRQYGARLAYVTYPKRGGYVCNFRKSNKALTRQAANKCRKSGMRLVRVTSIKIKGNQSVTRFVCRR
jgi:hypothetical protein